MNSFQPGQIVKHGHGAAAHYAVVIAEHRTVGWTSSSCLEVKPIESFAWEIVTPRYESFDLDQIKANIREFKQWLGSDHPPQYHVTEFNCEHWATLMVTGHSYSTQSGSFKLGAVEMIGGAMVVAGSSAGTVVSVAGMVGAAASTGTAISSLSGAAATNAALAWLGGGSIAAGGGGVAAGSAILAAVSTGGAVIAVAGIGLITKQVWDNLDESKRQELIAKLDQATPDQVKVLVNTTSETIQTFVAEKSQWLGDQSSKLAEAVRDATPVDLNDRWQAWVGKGQETLVATGEITAQAWGSTQETASEWMHAATQQIGNWIRR